MTEGIVSCRRMTMSFPGTTALDNVNIDFVPGEVHAVVGHNGSGKSTLIKVLAGYYTPAAYTRVTVAGAALRLGNAQASRIAGLRFVHQDLGLIPTLSTVENLALVNGFAADRGRPIRWRGERDRARAAIRRLGFDFEVLAPVSTLSPAERTGIALARALDHDRTQLLVLDEPTAALPKPDAERLFEVVSRLRDAGVAILYVSHHLDEVLRISDRVTALSGGRVTGTVATADLDHNQLVELIVGRSIEPAVAATGVTGSGDAVLRLRGLGGARLRGLDVDVRAREIVGVAGLEGSGREELARLVFGASARTGEVRVRDRVLRPDRPAEAVRAGIALLPAERKEEGIFAALTVRENVVMSSLGSAGHRPIVPAAERADTLERIRQLSVSPLRTELPIAALSGGNQQKVLIAKWLRTDPCVLLLDEPTQGVDIGSREEIYRELHAAAARGCAVVVCSSDSQELSRLCHRVLVLVRGRVLTELDAAAADAEVIDRWCLATERTEHVA